MRLDQQFEVGPLLVVKLLEFPLDFLTQCLPFLLL